MSDEDPKDFVMRQRIAVCFCRGNYVVVSQNSKGWFLRDVMTDEQWYVGLSTVHEFIRKGWWTLKLVRNPQYG